MPTEATGLQFLENLSCDAQGGREELSKERELADFDEY